MSSSKPSPPPPQQRADGWWSDGETTALIDAWGPLYVARNRGSLPTKDWRVAASAVNARRAAAGRRFNRTRVQCQTRLHTLKERYKRELAKPPPSGWRHFSRLQVFLAGPEYPPPGFPPKMLPASIKKEEEEECQVGSGGGGLLRCWAVPTRPRNGAAAWCPAAVVVTKLAEVYERVELARLEVEKEKVAMEREKACKNRLDYLKKRLKAERSRSKGGPAPAPPPPPSVDRLRALLRLAPSVPPGFTPRGGAIPKVGEEEKAESCASPLPRSWPSVPKRPRTAVALLPLSSSTGHQHGDGGTPCTEVAAALDRLAGTYERVEVAKQKEATRLEERRLEAMRDLEIERMRILVDVAISASASAVADAATATAASSSCVEKAIDGDAPAKSYIGLGYRERLARYRRVHGEIFVLFSSRMAG
uniref:Myb/SANT-like DNA-binding domain-containing protein n=1 Tax=Oryza punctata TaxID=4537 RepID=A0A0E0KCG1_ORYPU